jgi:hypothetical protein
MREAILEELGLMPLWQLRRSAAADAEVIEPAADTGSALTVVSVSRDNGPAGWILLDEVLAVDAAVLFTNMLQAMHLHEVGTMQCTYDGLPAAAVESQPQWLWVTGATLAQRMLKSDTPAAGLIRQTWRWQDLPVFVSARPRELLAHPQDKAEVWAGWCGWLAAL